MIFGGRVLVAVVVPVAFSSVVEGFAFFVRPLRVLGAAPDACCDVEEAVTGLASVDAGVAVFLGLLAVFPVSFAVWAIAEDEEEAAAAEDEGPGVADVREETMDLEVDATGEELNLVRLPLGQLEFAC